MAGGGKQRELVVLAAALLLLAAASPAAYGQIPLSSGIITGRFCCTPSGNCPPGAVGIPGVNVSLNCMTLFNGAATVAKNVTNATGAFSVGVTNLLGAVGPLLSGIIPCNIAIKLPISNTICPIFTAINGTVTGIPTLLNILLGPAFTLLGNFGVPLLSVNASV